MSPAKVFITWIKLYCRCGNVNKVFKHFYKRSYHNLNLKRIKPKKNKQQQMLRGALGSSSVIGTCTWYDLKILQRCRKIVKTRSQIVLETNFYVCKCYMRKTSIGDLFAPPSSSWIGLSSRNSFIKARQCKAIRTVKLKSDFKITINWSKYQFKRKSLLQNRYLSYLTYSDFPIVFKTFFIINQKW